MIFIISREHLKITCLSNDFHTQENVFDSEPNRPFYLIQISNLIGSETRYTFMKLI